eukprot:852060_1
MIQCLSEDIGFINVKQTILSSVIRTDGNVLNKQFIRSINTNLIAKIAKIRTKYDNNGSLYLYDVKFNDKYKGFDKTLPVIKEAIHRYFQEQTSPSPHAQDTIITRPQ